MKSFTYVFFQIIATTAIVTTIAGCGGGGGGSNIPSGPTVFTPGYIYIGDTGDEGAAKGKLSAFPNFSFQDVTTFKPTGSAGITSHQIAFDNNGKLLIADNEHHRIVRIDDMLGTNRVDFGTNGTGANQFDGPTGIAVDSQNRIYVSDFFNQRIIRMDDMAGTNWTELSTNTAGIGQPRQIMIDGNDKLYVISIFGALTRFDGISGANKTTYAPSGNEAFNNPIGLTMDSTDRIYITDSGNNRIVRINDMTGAGRVEFGSFGTGLGQFKFPTGIAIDPAGAIIICDFENDRIVKMDDMSGAGIIARGHSGSGSGKFSFPDGIAIR